MLLRHVAAATLLEYNYGEWTILPEAGNGNFGKML